MIRIMILIVLFVIESLSAQDFQGTVIYKTNRKVDIKIDDSKVNADMQKHIQEMLKKQFQKEYSLDFNKTESVYKEEENLGAPQPSRPGMRMMIAGASGAGL